MASDRTARLAANAGLASACVLRRGPDDDVLLVLANQDVLAVDAIERFRVLLDRSERLPRARFPWLEWPVLVTPRVFAGAFLFDASLRDPSAVLGAWGAPLPPVRIPPDSERDTFDAARRLSIFVRARGRRFRTDLSGDRESAMLRRELTRLSVDGGAFVTERDLLAFLRERLNAERSATAG